MNKQCVGCIRHPNCSKIYVSLYEDCPFRNNIHDPAFKRWARDYELDFSGWNYAEDKKEKAAEGRRRAIEERRVG